MQIGKDWTSMQSRNRGGTFVVLSSYVAELDVDLYVNLSNVSKISKFLNIIFDKYVVYMKFLKFILSNMTSYSQNCAFR